jgi:hypothetical protein
MVMELRLTRSARRSAKPDETVNSNPPATIMVCLLQICPPPVIGVLAARILLDEAAVIRPHYTESKPPRRNSCILFRAARLSGWHESRSWCGHARFGREYSVRQRSPSANLTCSAL